MTSDKSDKISGGETLRRSNGLLTRKIRIGPEHPYHTKTHCRGATSLPWAPTITRGSVFLYGYHIEVFLA